MEFCRRAPRWIRGDGGGVLGWFRVRCARPAEVWTPPPNSRRTTASPAGGSRSAGENVSARP
eukprot:8057425-Lingulodinium_polyedra.AAC.1